MAWSERQAAMLKEMGLRVDVRAAALPVIELDNPQKSPHPVEAAAKPVAPPRPVATQAKPVPASLPVPLIPLTVARPVSTEAIATMGWPELRSAVASCTACKLCEGRTQTVFGVGDANAHWMVVGEAPGEQEDAQGEPFVGKSGQLLDNMLRALGLSRKGVESSAVEANSQVNGEVDSSKCVYIANSVKCRPPGNRNPSADELAQCEPYLMRQVALLQPKIILAMGRFAVQSLLRSAEPIGKLRGRVHDYCGVPLIVTYHPAYLLRNLEEKARAWEDLCLAAQTYEAQVLSKPLS